MSDDVVEIDLDAMRAARLEKVGVRQLRFKGEVITLPEPEFLFTWREAYERDNAVEIVQLVLGPEGWAQLVALNPSDDDLRALAAEIPRVYGIGRGESPASGSSSKTSGARSRRTSGGTTASTSAKRSGAKARSASAASAP